MTPPATGPAMFVLLVEPVTAASEADDDGEEEDFEVEPEGRLEEGGRVLEEEDGITDEEEEEPGVCTVI